jgi:ribosomal protein S18 acetylase RimI-like enzyme
MDSERRPRAGLIVRPARPADYDAIVAVADAWWGRPVTAALPRLFLDHFSGSSLVAEDGEDLAGFLVGFMSPGPPAEAYIHFAGVHPACRGTGLARRLYGQFIAAARADGRRVVRAVTSPANDGSIRFHRAMGFTAGGPVGDYNGPGRDMVTFELAL